MINALQSVQLANTYSLTKKYGVDGWQTSPKIDGVRAVYIPNFGILGRNLETRYSVPHIENICFQQDTILDGELYIPGESFDRISGLARAKRNVAGKTDLQFHVFAQIIPNYTFVNTELMIESITEVLPDNQRIVIPVKYTYVDNNPLAIELQNEKNAADGYPEGTMLRHPDIAYVQRRSNELLKVKNVSRGNFVVIEVIEGRGKYRNMMGAIKVRGLVAGNILTSNVGTGFTDAERREIWNNRTNYIGREAEIVYLNPTTGSLRQPVFTKFLG